MLPPLLRLLLDECDEPIELLLRLLLDEELDAPTLLLLRLLLDDERDEFTLLLLPRLLLDERDGLTLLLLPRLLLLFMVVRLLVVLPRVPVFMSAFRLLLRLLVGRALMSLGVSFVMLSPFTTTLLPRVEAAPRRLSVLLVASKVPPYRLLSLLSGRLLPA